MQVCITMTTRRYCACVSGIPGNYDKLFVHGITNLRNIIRVCTSTSGVSSSFLRVVAIEISTYIQFNGQDIDFLYDVHHYTEA